MVKKVLPVVIGFVLLLLSATEGRSLPHCRGMPWTYCFGSHTNSLDGCLYRGEWVNNKRHGQGTTTCPDFTYVGKWANNQWLNGTFSTSDGEIYSGKWKDGKLNGQGSFTLPDGVKYVGEFKDGKPHGHGTYTYADGSKYVGEFKDGTIHGQGTRTLLGEWKGKKGVIVERYSGEWEYFEYHGKGILEKIERNAIEKGIFRRGILIDGERKHDTHFKDNIYHKELFRRTVRVENVFDINSSAVFTRKNINKSNDKKLPQNYSAQPERGLGSGFIISKKLAITNSHIVEKCKSIEIVNPPEHRFRLKLIATDSVNDLAVLEMKDDSKFLVQPLKLRNDDVKLGEKVIVAGYPLGTMVSTDVTITEGIVSNKKGYKGRISRFQFTAPIQQGNSGGPVYDKSGNLIGVTVSMLDKVYFLKKTGSMPENMNFAIKVSSLKQFLSASDIEVKTTSLSRPLSTEKIAKLASQQTLQISCLKSSVK